MIVVTGATGKTGSEIVRLLSAKGVRVRALVRDPARMKRGAGPGVEVVTADLAKPLSLDPVFRGADKIYLVSSPEPEQAAFHGNAIDSAKRAGVKQVVRQSAIGASASSTNGLLRMHGEADDRLSRSGLSFTILRPNSFYQNTLAYAASVAESGVIRAAMKDAKASMVDCRDVAAAATAVLTSETHSGRIYDLTGPRAIGFDEVATILGKAIGKPVRYEDVPTEAAREAFIANGLSAWLADGLLDLYAAWLTGRYAEVTEFHERITGKPPRPYEDFAKDFATVFRGRAEQVEANSGR
ncbi:MAG: SDR family oxidoreductase [Hyphomicrobiales bacterium]